MEKDFYVPFVGFPNARIISLLLSAPAHLLLPPHIWIIVVNNFRLLDITMTSLSNINNIHLVHGWE